MQYCVDHPEEISKLAKVKAQVSEVKGVMMENIEKVSWSKLYVLLFGCVSVVKNRKKVHLLPNACCLLWFLSFHFSIFNSYPFFLIENQKF